MLALYQTYFLNISMICAWWCLAVSVGIKPIIYGGNKNIYKSTLFTCKENMIQPQNQIILKYLDPNNW